MITDELIDNNSAKYFCLFKDKQFLSQIDQVLSEQNKAKGKKLMKKAIQKAPSKKLNEAAFLAPLAIPAAEWAISQLAAALAAMGIAYFGSKALTTAVNSIDKSGSTTGPLKPSIEPPPPTVSYNTPNNTVGQVSIQMPTTTQTTLPVPIQFTPQQTVTQQTVDNIVAATTASAATPTPPPNKTPWWRKLLGWLGASIMSFFSWLAGLLATLGIHVTAEALAGIFTGLAAFAAYITPRIMYWIRRCMKGNVAAEVQFKTTDGNEYSCWYSYKDFKWHCNYLGARLMSKTKVSNDDAQSLLSTNFFNKFKNECEKTLRSVFDDNDRFTAVCATVLLLKDKKLQEEYKNILEAKEGIINGFNDIKIVAA